MYNTALIACSQFPDQQQDDAFDVEGLARQLQTVVAPCFFITIGQGSGHYCAPNATYDRIWRQRRQVPFMENIEAIHREWSTRWGPKVSGWWVDGCYEAEYRFPEGQPPNFQTLAAALRAGNDDAIVAFIPGVLVPVICHSVHEDYTASEIAGVLPECPGPWVEREAMR